jgi:hypothetical protein
MMHLRRRRRRRRMILFLMPPTDPQWEKAGAETYSHHY